MSGLRRSAARASIAFSAAAVLALLASSTTGVASVRRGEGNAVAAGTLVVGRSARGRPIVARVLGPASAPRKILLVGCIHGNECAGRAILAALERKPLGAGVQLWLLSSMNPDGEAADTRQNAHGVDLNRNFPYQWQPGGGATYYAGPHPASEPETRVAMRLIARLQPAVTIWYHQHEDLVDMAGGDRGVARRYAELAGLRATCLPFLPGTATAWANYNFAATTSFVVELPAGAVSRGALALHVSAVRAIERGQHSGSRTSCAR
jgi:protein MpaA